MLYNAFVRCSLFVLSFAYFLSPRKYAFGIIVTPFFGLMTFLWILITWPTIYLKHAPKINPAHASTYISESFCIKFLHSGMCFDDFLIRVNIYKISYYRISNRNQSTFKSYDLQICTIFILVSLLNECIKLSWNVSKIDNKYE